MILMYVGKECATIIQNRHHPRTVQSLTSVYEQDGLAWGQFPTIVLASGGWFGHFKGPDGLVSDPYSDTWIQKFKQVDPRQPSVKVEGKYAIIDASMLVPYFPKLTTVTPDTPWVEEPRVRAILYYTKMADSLNWEQAHGFDLGTQDPSSPPFDVSAPSPVNYQLQAQIPPGACAFLKFTVKKAVRAKYGTYWGWPWEGDHTKAEYTVVQNGVIKWDVCGFSSDKTNVGSGSPSALMLEFMFDKTIVVTKPVGILAQLGELLSSVGGYLALIPTVFFLFFVKLHPDVIRKPSFDPKEALTMRFLGKKASGKNEEDSGDEEEEDDEESNLV